MSTVPILSLPVAVGIDGTEWVPLARVSDDTTYRTQTQTIGNVGTIQGGLNSITTTRGSLVYRGATAWLGLAPSTLGYVLSTQGPGADPTWIPAPATGLTVGTTTIAGGSSGRFLYDNAGVLGELALAAVATSGSAADLSAGTLAAARMPALTGDITTSVGTVSTVLATVNSNVGSWGLASSVAQFTVNAKGLITAAANVAISIAAGAVSGLAAIATSGSASDLASGTVPAARLPNPSATTLGGIESLAAVSSKWINTISTSGVPSATQPAFTDISGSVAAAQLPNPSASTLGGIESLAAVASKWINAISTSGVPSATQPAFSDIASTPTTLAGYGITNGADTALDNLASVAINLSLLPGVDGAIDLGSTTKEWGNLYLKSGGALNWNSGNVTLTHSANQVTLAGSSAQTDLQIIQGFIQLDDEFGILDQNANRVFICHGRSNAVNYFHITNGESGHNVQVTAAGADADVAISFACQGGFNDPTFALKFDLGTGGPSSALFTNSGLGGAYAVFYNNYASSANGQDLGGIIIRGNDSTGSRRSYAQITGLIVDNTHNAEYGRLVSSVIVNHLLTDKFELDGTAAYPTTDNDIALGKAAQGYSGLFLASGGVINWNNGNVTLTQSSGTLTCSGNIGIGNVTPSATFLAMGVGTTAKSQVNWGTTSVAPTTPNNGDMWFDGTNLKIRIGGATKTVTVS